MQCFAGLHVNDFLLFLRHCVRNLISPTSLPFSFSPRPNHSLRQQPGVRFCYLLVKGLSRHKDNDPRGTIYVRVGNPRIDSINLELKAKGEIVAAPAYSKRTTPAAAHQMLARTYASGLIVEHGYHDLLADLARGWKCVHFPTLEVSRRQGCQPIVL